MATLSMRVLVAEDFEPFRRVVASILQRQPELQIICEVSDGLRAVQKAEELQPDLILLDIGLPLLNGIEAARQIRELAPESKIIFVSQESSAEIVQEALRVGALGYVFKTHAGSELLVAVEAVCQGRQFVSSRLSSGSFGTTTNWQARRKEALLSLVLETPQIARNHRVQFSSDDASFLTGFTRFIEAALRAGNLVIAIATESHRNSLFERLRAHGLNIGAAIKRGNYIPLDVADTLSTFMVNDLPDPVRFQKVTGNLLLAATKTAKGKRPRVAACGECAPILWAQGKAGAAIRLEQLWDQIARTHDIDILCGYVMKSSQREHERQFYERICAEHSAACSQ